MYLRTPKRYQPRRRRSLRLFSGRKLIKVIMIVAIAYGGYLIWQNRVSVRNSVMPEIEGFAESMQTQVAPLPTPTVEAPGIRQHVGPAVMLPAGKELVRVFAGKQSVGHRGAVEHTDIVFLGQWQQPLQGTGVERVIVVEREDDIKAPALDGSLVVIKALLS